MLELRRFEKGDCSRLISWIPDARFLLQWSGPKYCFPLDLTQLEETMRKCRGGKPEHYMFKVRNVSTDEVIGHMELAVLSRENRAGHLCKVLIGNPAHRGKGYGTEMISSLLDFAFNRIALRQVTLAVFDFNKFAIVCYRRCGFQEYDFKENATHFEDEHWNVILMKLKKDDWLRNRRKC